VAGKPKKINYIQLEPSAFLSDGDFQMMTDAERGIYGTIIFYMYCNNGRIKNDPEAIQKLCNVASDFDLKWESVRPKFYQKGVWLRHRRVDLELKKAKEKIQASVNAGLKGAKKRWGGYNDPNSGTISFAIANENETKRKRREGNITNSKERISTSSNSLRFISELEKIVRPRTQSDRTAFRNLCKWLADKISVNQFDDEIYIKILDYAREAKDGRKPIAVFFSTLRREIGYKALAD
jgi:uncharacterized protein YdaU (DUF1376 family)